jgi:hypothetical protein
MQNSTRNGENFANMRALGASGRRVYRVCINYSRVLRKIYHFLRSVMRGVPLTLSLSRQGRGDAVAAGTGDQPDFARSGKE